MPPASSTIRTTSGCFTCRVRKKKCDEHRVGDDGSCSTCVRLQLDCLGYGKKRPDWLRGTEGEIRARIKKILAARGMIKGRARPGKKNQPQAQEGFIQVPDLCHNMPAETGDCPTENFSPGSPEPKDLVESCIMFPPNQYQQFSMCELEYHGPSDLLWPDSSWCDSSFAQYEYPNVTGFEGFSL